MPVTQSFDEGLQVTRFQDKRVKIYVAGHRGLVGSALVRKLYSLGYRNIVMKCSAHLDLRDQSGVNAFIERERPEYVFLAAGRVGGILANATCPADFLYDNVTIAANVIHAAYRFGVRKLLNLGSSCIYPKDAPQPVKEEHLLSGPLEETNKAYAIAKIAAIELCDSYRTQHGCDFVSAMPANLYGPGDNFDLRTSHVLPALIRKFHEAKLSGATPVEIWGTGTPKREFLYVDDLADACMFLMEHVSEPGPVNVGTGQDLSILQLAKLVRRIVGCDEAFIFNTDRPDGAPRKLLDVSKLRSLGWSCTTPLQEGIERTYQWFLANEPATTVHTD